MTLSTAGCSRLWKSAQAAPPKPWEGKAHCRGCPIGARHAGEAQDDTKFAAEAWSRICPRCTKVTDRMIQERLCIGCYNRDLEAAKGRNAKGGRPRLCDILHASTLAVAREGRVGDVTMLRVTGRVEVMLRLAQRTEKPIAFGVPRFTPPTAGAHP